MKPVLSIVDYEAWNRGYMPPSEHILIDALSYREAKVILSSDYGNFAFWVVIRGKRPRREIMRKIAELFQDLPEDDAPKTDEVSNTEIPASRHEEDGVGK